jgi:GNAT superfamily N-acetyltransferase
VAVRAVGRVQAGGQSFCTIVRVQIKVVRFDHPHAVQLTALVQQEYVERYGSTDITPLDDSHFDPPDGTFLIGYEDGAPVACGGWRAQSARHGHLRDGDAEIKRMFVAPAARGRGHARSLLAALEESARRAGRARMVLETGTRQPEAIALYRSCGYTDMPKFGVYRDDPQSLCMAKELRGLRPSAGRR